MADYHPLIAKAVAGLEHNTGENRRALYERARAALLAQLRGVDPPLNEADVTRERLALEEAIRKVENEAGQRPREGGEDGARSEDTPRQTLRPPGPSLTDAGLKDFRTVVAESQVLGEASKESSRSAREAYESLPGGAPRAPPEQVERPAPSASEVPAPPTAPRFDPPPPPRPAAPPPGHEASVPSSTPSETPPDQPDSALEPLQESWPPGAPPRYEEASAGYQGPRRSWAWLVKLIVLLLVLGAVGAGAYWQRDRITALVASLQSATTTTAPAPEKRDTGVRPKIADRVGDDQSRPGTRPAAAPTADVAQKVVLYDEDPADPQGKRYVGSVIWRTETVSPGPGLAPELAVRADVEIPERHIRMSWSLRRNTDKALPASHTIEIMFTLPADFPDGGISNVPGVLMKQNEQARGVPLAGLAVKVTNGFFLIGLSAVEVDLQRNIALLKERPWFDIPIVYNNGKRAILAVEKGTPGERVFEEAFRAWGQ
jgi:hypothetical protein